MEDMCEGRMNQTRPLERETPKLHESVIVSHIPISIGSRQESSSSSSSTISSKSDEELGSTMSHNLGNGKSCHGGKVSNIKLQRPRDNEDSRDESSPLFRILASSPTLASRMPSDFMVSSRKRTVSMEESVQEPQRAYEKKKPRLGLNLLSSQVDSPAAESHTSSSTSILLATSKDPQCLTPLHVFVRKQIEVFAATESELRQPAPGRKQPIQLTQVGLRCLHCKSRPKPTRVKRAVCYPTNIGRIYSAVSDMKFDHFNHCLNLPASVRAEFDQLKKQAEQEVATDEKTKRKSRTSSTSQFYCDSAIALGMHDGPGGIFMSSSTISVDSSSVSCSLPAKASASFTSSHSISSSIETSSIDQSVSKETAIKTPLNAHPERHSLNEDTDVDHLNAIHCFVRKHTEFFAASNDDIVAPAPGRKTKVLLGQVGIRCIHCSTLPFQQRVKRAACYPPRVDGIYHAISNMKFDHFTKCQGLPDDVRSEFQSLQEALCRKGSGGNSGGATSSTKKYYRASAVRKGLVDTDAGIRFQSRTTSLSPRSPSPPSEISDRMFALVEVACLAGF